ncbi:hypothetical protein [Agrococcus casei]|uniref:hypothetical protein n=1 Tax=Agrococcus casei TaxID=343512 RepID=UPI003F8FC57B
MNKQKWIALTAAGTMSLGLVASGAIAAANATGLQDAQGEALASAQGGTVQQAEVHENKRFTVGAHTNMKLVSVQSADSPASAKSAASVSDSYSAPSAPSAPAPQQPAYNNPAPEPTYNNPVVPNNPQPDSPNSPDSGWSAPSADSGWSAPSADSND